MKHLFAALVALIPPIAEACEIELILAMDVSRSVMNAEFDLQMQGLAAGFRDPAVIDAITYAQGGVMATVTQWSGAADQAQSVGWRHLVTADDIAAFANLISAQRRAFFGAYTATGEALRHAAKISAENPIPCRRKVIDISGDGRGNRGAPPRAIADALAEQGFTINALAILGARPDPLAYYRKEVIAGPGAFAEAAEGFEAYAAAARRKLLRELAPAFAMRGE